MANGKEIALAEVNLEMEPHLTMIGTKLKFTQDSENRADAIKHTYL